MVKCVNPDCGNYKQELEEGTEVCALCGKETEVTVTSLDGRKKLAPVVAIGSIASIIIAFLPIPYFFFVGLAVLAACIVTSFIIRIKSAIIVSLLAILGMAAALASYGFFDMLF